MKNVLIFFIIAISLISCRKDKHSALIKGECDSNGKIEIPYYQYSFVYSGAQYMKAAFNPNNSNEFAYHYRNGVVFELRTFDVSTKEHRTIATSVNLLSKPSWSTLGKIAFDNAFNYHIWVVNQNGDSLTQITHNTANLYPAWSPDGMRLIHYYSPVLGYPYYLLSSNQTLELLDTIKYDYAGYSAIASAGAIASHISQGSSIQVGISSINEGSNLEYSILVDLKEKELGTLTSLSISPSGETVYFTSYVNSENDGLFAIDVNSGTLSRIKEHCLFNVIQSVDCSPDGKHLLLERRSQKLEYSEDGQFMGRILIEARLYLLDLQTGLEFPIDIQ
jgi:Tol biopolymer transport system component